MLTNPEGRRALRSVVQALAVFILLAYLWYWAERLDGPALREVARWSLAIIGLAELGYVMENGIRSFKASKSGIEVEAGGE